MSDQTRGQSARAKRSKRRRDILIAAGSFIATVGVCAAVVIPNLPGWLERPPGASPSAAPATTPAETEASFPVDTPSAADGAAPCTLVRVLSSLENAEMVTALAAAYDASPRDIGGRCVDVAPAMARSGVAATDAATGFQDVAPDDRPTVWMPDASTWLSVANAEGGGAIVPSRGTSVGTSNVVLAMPVSLADSIGWNEDAPSWGEIFEASEDEQLWTNLGHPEWGSFKLGKTSPIIATSGQAAMFASYGASSDGIDSVTHDEVEDSDVRAAVTEHELAVSHYMATPEHFLWHARQSEAQGSAADFLSAVIVDEKSVWDYNRGISSRDGITREQIAPPSEPLVPIYPSDGHFVADNPGVVLTGDWVDTAEAAAAEDFLRFATTAEGQAVVREGGYRDLHGELDSGVAAVGQLPANATGAASFPNGETVQAVLEAFPDVRKPANVLFLLDVSGSMDEPIATGQTKLDAAKEAIALALPYFGNDDDVGLAAFASGPDPELAPGMVFPPAPIVDEQGAFLLALGGLQTLDDTPLYEAVDTFTAQHAAAADPSHINAIVVLSDGRDEPTASTTTRDEMLADLAAQQGAAPVLVFTLAYGTGADAEVLAEIAAATGAHFYDASDPTEIDDVLGDLVTSF